MEFRNNNFPDIHKNSIHSVYMNTDLDSRESRRLSVSTDIAVAALFDPGLLGYLAKNKAGRWRHGHFLKSE